MTPDLTADVGFTGTRQGMTLAQRDVLRSMILSWKWLHHGDCVGADEQAHNLALDGHRRIFIHPPQSDEYRAYCAGHDAAQPKPYLARNRDIVDVTSHLIAAPEGPERARSGTWSTVRYARRIGRPITIILPSGQITKENHP